MEPRAASVLVVDDDIYAREALSLYFSRDRRTHLYGSAASIDEALRLGDPLGLGLPDVVLLDISLGEAREGGIEGIPRLRERYPDTKVLMCSVSATDDLILTAMANGADGYVWKEEAAQGIVNAIVRTRDGYLVCTPTVADRIVRLALDLGERSRATVIGDSRFSDMSGRLRTTAFLYCNAGMSKAEIADELGLSEDAIRSRLKALFALLGASSKSDAFQALVERGTIE
jgi:DNA-binding NarL/FixJ family response regulator